MIDPDNVSVLPTPKGGLKIVVEDVESDSLVILEIRRDYGSLMAKLGLRGNFSMRGNRGMRRVYA